MHGRVRWAAGQIGVDGRRIPVNRWTGTLVDPTPATQVAELIDKIPQALENLLNFSEKEQIQHGRS